MSIKESFSVISLFNFVVNFNQFMRRAAVGGEEKIDESEIVSNTGLWSLDRSLRF